MNARTAIVVVLVVILGVGCFLILSHGPPPASAPVSECKRTDSDARSGVVVTVTRANANAGKLALTTTITNNSDASIFLLEDPALPGREATLSTLALRYDVEDDPLGADANVNIFPVPAMTLLARGATVTRRVEIHNPTILSNWLHLHWDSSTIPPTYLRRPPSVRMVPPLKVRVVVGYGTEAFEYTTTTIPQDERLAFLAWQRRAASSAITIDGL